MKRRAAMIGMLLLLGVSVAARHRPLTTPASSLSHNTRSARAFDAPPAGEPVAQPTPHPADRIVPVSNHVGRGVIPLASVEGKVIDVDSGDLIAWGRDREDDEAAVIVPARMVRADLTADGRLDAADLLRLLEQIGAQAPQADIDGDRAVNQRDLHCFLQLLFGE